MMRKPYPEKRPKRIIKPIDKMSEVVRAIKSDPAYENVVITWSGDKIVITQDPSGR